MLTKQTLGMQQSFHSNPGAVAVGSTGGQLSQMEQDILSKQRLAPPSGSFSGRPGATILADDRVGCNLSQMEHDILTKHRESACPGPNSPGVVAVSLEGAGAQLLLLEQDMLTKQGVGPMKSTETRSNSLSQTEPDILAKQRGNMGLSVPGAVSVLSQVENEVMAKQVDAACTSVNSGQNGVFPQTELSIAKHHLTGQVASVPGAVATSAQLSQLEQDILAKEGTGVVQTSGNSGLSQLERDVLSKQRPMQDLNSAIATMSRFEADVTAKHTASLSSSPAPRGGSGEFEMDRDLTNKSTGHSSVPPSGPGAASSQFSRFFLNDLENEILAKSSAPAPLESSALAAMPQRGSGEQFNGVHSLERHGAIPPSTYVATHLDQNGDGRDHDLVQPGYEYEYGQGGLQDYIQHGYNYEYRQGARQDYGQPDYDFERRQGGRQDYAGTENDYEYARSLQQHELMQRSHPGLARQMDSNLPPSMGEDVDSVPQPLSVPYSLSDEHEGANDVESDFYDAGPNFDVPDGRIEAYVPPTVVEAAGVAVVMSTEEEERLDKEKRKKYLFGGAICVCLVALAIIIPTVLTAAGGSTTEALGLPPSMAPSLAPSAAPSGAPTSSAFADFLEDVVKPLNVSSDDVFNDVHSPQYQAALWLVEEDSKNYWEQQDLNPDHAKVIQRYALATFHYAAGGNNWRLCGKESSSCPRVAWLSPVDECTWHFVDCDDTGVVQMLDFRK
jgi:hypothetical protein